MTWEWDIGSRGVLVRASGPDTTILLPNAPDSAFLCVLRVTDDDGQIGLDTLRIRVIKSRMAPPFPHARQGMAAAAIDGKIFLVGGIGPGDSPLAQVDEFDPVSGISVRRSPMAYSRKSPGIAVLDGRLYVARGFGKGPGVNQTHMTTFERYEPAEDRWTTLKPLSNIGPITSLAAANGRIYAIHGLSGKMEIYNPLTDIWTENSAPDDLGWNRAVTLDNRIYCLALDNSILRIYDAVGEKWHTARWAPGGPHGLAVAENRIFAFGGEVSAEQPGGSARQWSNSAYEYLPGDDRWVEIDPMLRRRSRSLAVGIGPKIYLFPGEYHFYDPKYADNDIGSEVEEYYPR